MNDDFTLLILQLNDRHTEVWLERQESDERWLIATVNHDNEGWAGMESTVMACTELAQRLGLRVVSA